MATLLSPGAAPTCVVAPLSQFRGMREAWQPRCSSIPPCAKAAPIRCPNPETTVTKTYQIEPGEEPPPPLPPLQMGLNRSALARAQLAAKQHLTFTRRGTALPLAHSPRLGIAPEMRHHSQPSRTPLSSANPLQTFLEGLFGPTSSVHQVRSPR